MSAKKLGYKGKWSESKINNISFFDIVSIECLIELKAEIYLCSFGNIGDISFTVCLFESGECMLNLTVVYFR